MVPSSPRNFILEVTYSLYLFKAIVALKCLANFIQNFLFHLKYLPPLAKNIATLGRPALLNPSILIKNAVDGEYSDKL